MYTDLLFCIHMTKILTARVQEDLAARVQKASSESGVEKSAFLRILIKIGLEETEQELALKRYQKGEISLGKFADLLEMTKWDAIDLLKEKKVAFQYDEDNLQEDLTDL